LETFTSSLSPGSGRADHQAGEQRPFDRRVPDGAPVTSAFPHSLRGFQALRDLREGLRAWMTAMGCEEDEAADLLLAVSEVATNGIEASPTEEADVTAEGIGELLRVRVRNEGVPFFGKDPSAMRVEGNTRGRGLDIAGLLVDQLIVDHVDGCTEVTLLKSC
jgi:anti-sigma regulatory factor (Ser/Thr protein kinase)